MENKKSSNNITIYGLSTEGYKIASMLSIRGLKTSIIDESSSLSISLKPDIAKNYPTVSSLIEDEPLLNIEPIDIAISNANYLFFTPRIRKIGSESKTDILAKFRDIIKFLSEGASIIYTLPTGIGGNNEIVALIEHMTGFTVGQDIHYYYMPINNKITSSDFIVGAHSSIYKDEKLIKICNDIGYNNVNVIDVSSAEITYEIQILRTYTDMASILEMHKFLPMVQANEERHFDVDLYIDNITNGLYDLRILSASLTGSGAIMYLINGTIKSIEGYIKHLINRIRDLLKKREVKASRAKVIIAWDIDTNEIRGDKIEFLSSLELKLKDYIADVEIFNKTFDTYSLDRTTIILICSEKDYINISNKNKITQDTIIVKANPLCEII